jgi:hypothetical protein
MALKVVINVSDERIVSIFRVRPHSNTTQEISINIFTISENLKPQTYINML